jgi:hypothetical protein
MPTSGSARLRVQVSQETITKLTGWRSLLWVPVVDPVHDLTTEDLLVFGDGNKAKLLCFLTCKSELWGHPERCPFCMQPLPRRG